MPSSYQTLKNTVMEAIDFQNGDFGKELEKHIEALQSITEFKDKYDSKEVTILTRLIQDSIKTYTGLTISITFVEGFSASVFFNQLLFRNNLSDKAKLFASSSAKEIIKEAKKFSYGGSVNIKNGTVSGYYESKEFVSVICIGEGFFNSTFKDTKKYFSPAEVTAILLHEVGHVFTNIEYASRMITTNQALAAISKSLLDQDTQKEREIIIKAAGLLVCKDEDVFSGMEEINDQKITSIVFIDRLNKHKSELGGYKYDKTSIEYLSDQFANRHGYGRHFIFALEKLNAVNGMISNRLISNIQIARIICNLILLPYFMAFGLGFIASFLLVALSTIRSSYSGTYSDRDFTYDILKTRYLRVREDLIQQLKSNKLDKVIRDNVLQELEAIDNIIATLKDIDETFFEKVSAFFSKKNRDIKNSIQLQRELEELSANNLFVSSAKLSSIVS